MAPRRRGALPQSGRPRRRGCSRGQSLVEFALIAPVFFVVFFGIIEFAFILTTLSGYNFAAREGARYGSIIGNSDPNADTGILQAIIARTSSLPFGTPITVDIYKANQDGTCVGGTVGTAGCTEDQYTFSSPTTYSQGPLPLAWTPTSRNDTLIGADYLGVRVLYQYTFVTSFLNYYCNPSPSCTTGNAGTHLNLSATSVQRIEPQDFGGDVPSRAPLAVAAPGPVWPAWVVPSLANQWEGAIV